MSLWRDAWFLAGKDIHYILRERIALVWLCLLPVLLMFFIGTVTRAGTAPARALRVEAGVQGGFLLQRLIDELQRQGVDAVLTPATTAAPGQSKTGTLEVPAHLTRTLLAGDPVVLVLRQDATDLNGQLNQLLVQRAAYTVLADIAVLGGDAVSAAGLDALQARPRPLTLAVRSAGGGRDFPDGFQQSVPGIMVMFTMMVLLTSGAVLLYNERKQGVLRRLAATPISRAGLVLGKWGGKLALGLLQLGFAALAGHWLFGFHWGANWPMVILLAGAWAAFCASLGVLLGSVAQSEGQVIGLGVLATMSLAALGGCWWPIEVTPQWMQAVQSMLPSGWTMNALHQLVSYRASATSALPAVFALSGAAAIIAMLAARYFRYD